MNESLFIAALVIGSLCLMGAFGRTFRRNGQLTTIQILVALTSLWAMAVIWFFWRT